MKNFPSVMTVGARVCLYGFAFVWFPGKSPGLVAPTGTVIALHEHNHIPYISARVIYDAMRNPDRAHRKTGVLVCNGELKLYGTILVGDSAVTVSDDYGEAAMPGKEVLTPSSSSKFWEDGPEAVREAQLEDRPDTREGEGPPSRTRKTPLIAKSSDSGEGLLADDTVKPDTDAVDEQGPTTAGESGPDDLVADSETEWEADENETVPVRRNLRDEANSVAHYLFHRPGLPQHCEECRRAKTKRRKRVLQVVRRESARCNIRNERHV